jgi:hypothetical protein
MKLLDLPVEIIDEIISQSLPSGFEAFALCCHAIYTRAVPKITRHNSLKRRWMCTTIAGSKNCSDILRILCEIACDPLVGRYIESLSLRGRGGGPNVDTKNDEFRSNEGIMESIKNMVLKSECFGSAGVDRQLWWEDILREVDLDSEDGDNRDGLGAVHTTVSLLGQLPNLQTLQLPSGWYRRCRAYTVKSDAEKRAVAVLDAMVKAANDSHDQDQALGKLRIIVPSTEQGYEERAPFQVLECFMRLKSLEELYSTSCLAIDDGNTGIPFQWRIPEMNSNLRRIELAYCCMDEAGISVLLAHTPHLSVFRYMHECKWCVTSMYKLHLRHLLTPSINVQARLWT